MRLRSLRFIIAVLLFVGMSVFSNALPASAKTLKSTSSGSVQFLTLPFPADTNMNIQQGWYYSSPSPYPACPIRSNDLRLHCGIDYIDGTIDKSSTWQHFAVVAAADGEACAEVASNPRGNCVWGEGNRVLIKHDLGNGVILYTYYGHLNWIAPWIPIGNRNNTVHVTQGSQIGTSGDTGTTPGWVHLHFALTPPDFTWLDVYGLYTTREHYPDPNGTNGLTSAPNNYWTNNPPSYAPNLSTKLGGVDLQSYCQSLGYVGVSLDGTTAYDWHCDTQSGNHVGIWMDDACGWQYSKNHTRALVNDFYDPGSWKCYVDTF